MAGYLAIDAKKSIIPIFLAAGRTRNIFHSCLFRLFIWYLAFLNNPPSILHIRAALKVVHEIDGALDAGIGQLANFLTIKPFPAASVERFVELNDKLGVCKVDEGIPHITGVVVVDRQIQKINVQSMVFADLI